MMKLPFLLALALEHGLVSDVLVFLLAPVVEVALVVSVHVVFCLDFYQILIRLLHRLQQLDQLLQQLVLSSLHLHLELYQLQHLDVFLLQAIHKTKQKHQ